ncbi:unnamed protein product, partial [Dovyalis caffra]
MYKSLIRLQSRFTLIQIHLSNLSIHVDPDTPLKLVEYYGIINKVCKYDTIQDMPQTKFDKILTQLNFLKQTFRNF